MRTAFVGGGTMAEAILSRALERGVLSPAEITVAEPMAARRAHVESTYGVSTTGAGRDAIGGAEFIVLAVKPQNFPDVASGLSGTLVPSQTVLSIMAGVPLSRLCSELGHDRIIRIMPNTPAQVGAGASVWTATASVSETERGQASVLLASFGTQLYVEDEDLIDVATAVSGSGPAYVFRFMEVLTAAAVARGLNPEDAALLVEQTVYGSALLARESAESPARLREMVTSPGGTTEAALRALTESGFDTAVEGAVRAAYDRAKELGGN